MFQTWAIAIAHIANVCLCVCVCGRARARSRYLIDWRIFLHTHAWIFSTFFTHFDVVFPNHRAPSLLWHFLIDSHNYSQVAAWGTIQLMSRSILIALTPDPSRWCVDKCVDVSCASLGSRRSTRNTSHNYLCVWTKIFPNFCPDEWVTCWVWATTVGCAMVRNNFFFARSHMRARDFAWIRISYPSFFVFARLAYFKCAASLFSKCECQHNPRHWWRDSTTSLLARMKYSHPFFLLLVSCTFREGWQKIWRFHAYFSYTSTSPWANNRSL